MKKLQEVTSQFWHPEYKNIDILICLVSLNITTGIDCDANHP